MPPWLPPCLGSRRQDPYVSFGGRTGVDRLSRLGAEDDELDSTDGSLR